MIGGLLAEPALQYPSVFQNTIFETFPFLLPNLLLSVFTVVGLCLCLVFLPETLGKTHLYQGGPTGEGDVKEPLLAESGEGKEVVAEKTTEADPGMWRVVFCESDTCQLSLLSPPLMSCPHPCALLLMPISHGVGVQC